MRAVGSDIDPPMMDAWAGVGKRDTRSRLRTMRDRRKRVERLSSRQHERSSARHRRAARVLNRSLALIRASELAQRCDHAPADARIDAVAECGFHESRRSRALALPQGASRALRSHALASTPVHPTATGEPGNRRSRCSRSARHPSWLVSASTRGPRPPHRAPTRRPKPPRPSPRPPSLRRRTAPSKLSPSPSSPKRPSNSSTASRRRRSLPRLRR